MCEKPHTVRDTHWTLHCRRDINAWFEHLKEKEKRRCNYNYRILLTSEPYCAKKKVRAVLTECNRADCALEWAQLNPDNYLKIIFS